MLAHWFLTTSCWLCCLLLKAGLIKGANASPYDIKEQLRQWLSANLALDLKAFFGSVKPWLHTRGMPPPCEIMKFFDLAMAVVVVANNLKPKHSAVYEALLLLDDDPTFRLCLDLPNRFVSALVGCRDKRTFVSGQASEVQVRAML